ncbi:MAG: N-acetylmuramoyl-L-alanine amidase family protein [Eubacterium sp.]|nr:N-acetylmuramoyl-L-alanine amidase family protein [Eubacterium sp.]
MKKEFRKIRLTAVLLVLCTVLSSFGHINAADSKKAADTSNGTTSKTVKDFIETLLKPVGTTMYIYGGGWNEEDTGAGKEARTLGLSPKWAEFAAKQTSSYNHKDYNYKTDVSVIHLGLDCTGYGGWALYNVLETKNNRPGYVDYDNKVLERLQSSGYGTLKMASSVSDYKPGDIMNNDEHMWIVVGSCDDGSVVLLHASPPGVQISGTATPSGDRNSQANVLATYYMKKYYSSWYQRFPDSSRSASYLSGYDQYRWNGKKGLTDPDGYLSKSAYMVLKDIFGTAPAGFTDSRHTQFVNDKKPGWKKDSKGWWYRKKDGTYPKSQWLSIKGVKYFFDKYGYMVTGWKKIKGKWYYFNTDGRFVKGWKLIDGKWYYFKAKGVMATGIITVKGKKYYLRPNGSMLTGWKKIKGKWYYFETSGAMAKGWRLIDGNWYYLKRDGSMAASQYVNGYYLGPDGAMR